MPIASPFFFAWVEPDETTFDETHYRMDEYIFSARRTIAEGEKPLLEIEIQNPHVGILSAGRKYWAWFSWDNGSEIVPLFFGRVVGTPVEIFEEVVTLQFIAEPADYKQRVQRVAEALKYRPFYDPVFIDVGQRDDPDTILEAHAKVWDVDPVTHEVTANDIMTGDSNEDFTGDDHFYDSMSMTVGQPPATAILMDASVNWKQTAQGILDLGSRSYTSYGADGMVSDWPKPLQQLGGGWSVFSSDAYETTGAETASMHDFQWDWTNTAKKHENGDTLSTNISQSTPMGCRIGMTKMLTFENRGGVVWPGIVLTDAKGHILANEPSINHPPSARASTAYQLMMSVNATLVLEYSAERERTERAIFLVRADTQPVLSNPTLDQNSEVMTKSGANVGVPIVNLLNWSTIAGSPVSLGQIIFPDDPQLPGGKSVQICVTAGTAGTVPPDFSDVPGFTTPDGSVVWSSLGVSTPPENAVDWTAVSHVNAGAVILPKRPLVNQLSALLAPGLHVVPPKSVSLSEGTYIQNTDGSFGVVTEAGLMGPTGDTAVITPLASLPNGTTYFICTTAGVTGEEWLIPEFDETLHAATADGSAVWTCIGIGEIPVGGIPGDTPSPTYFATDRGRESLEYLAALVRAKLLYRSRCVEINFDCEYGRGAPLTTRQTATLHDPRIAGGVALGKIKTTVLEVSDTGVANCTVTLACAAGLGNAVDEYPGDPIYVDAGYVDEPYQQHENVTVLLPTTTDLNYAPPVYVANDDGITFPVTRDMVLVADTLYESDQETAVKSALDSMSQAAIKQAQSSGSMSEAADLVNQREIAMLQANSTSAAIAANPVWQEFVIKPVSGGPFNKVYNVKFSHLAIPMGIDLQSSTIT